jgi:hypothetical protein
MRLGLSSAAAPDATLDELIEGCVRRGLIALELESGHHHGLEPDATGPRTATQARARATAAGITIAGYRLATPTASDCPAAAGGPTVDDVATLGLCLVAPLLAEPRTALALTAARVPGACDVMAILPPGDQAIATLDALDAAGSAGRSINLAWDLDPGAGDVSHVAPEVLARAGGRLRHIRLLGGGPESTAQEGRGVGSVMVRLTLARFAGTVALAPSSARHRVIWSAWLGRRGGWGCGSKEENRDLVRLVSP